VSTVTGYWLDERDSVDRKVYLPCHFEIDSGAQLSPNPMYQQLLLA
jgi:hypothetical protein